MKKYKHLFFDLDHTLWDFNTNSIDTLTEIYNAFSLKNKIDASVKDFISTYQVINDKLWKNYREGTISKELLRSKRFLEALESFGFHDRNLAESIGNYYVKHSPQKTSLLPNTMEILNYLFDKYEMHIITNGFEEVQHIKLDKALLKRFFKHIVTSEAAGAKKPSRVIFDHALNLVDCNISESIMIGDSYEADILGAKEMGMDQVFFCHEAKWSGGKGTYNISNLIELKNLL